MSQTGKLSADTHDPIVPHVRTDFPWKEIMLTAALTSIATTLVAKWMPAVVSTLYSRSTENPVVVVEIQRKSNPVSGVAVTVSDVSKPSTQVVATGQTDHNGIVPLPVRRDDRILFLQATTREGDIERQYERLHSFESIPAHVTLNLESFRRTPVVIATRTHSDDPGTSGFLYSDDPLTSDRTVGAVLEIDFLEGTEPSEFVGRTSIGDQVTLAGLLEEVGIIVEVVWDDELPRSVMGSNSMFEVHELVDVMETHLDAEQQGKWHFYIVYGGAFEAGPMYEIMFDGPQRRGSAVFDSAIQSTESGALLHAMMHTIGHMLNLPHPWQAYGDTESVMTYPYRWNTAFPLPRKFYRFDSVASRHIRRSPEKYVRPGASKFGEYGREQPWVVKSGQEE